MEKRIVVIGSLNYDIILKIPRLSECGETQPVTGADFSAGGKGANQAVQAAKLGVETYMVGCVGEDAMGDFLINSSKEYGVNTKYIRKTKGESGMGVVQALEDGEVYAYIARGANFQITKEDVDGLVPLMKETGLVIMQMEIPMEIICYALDKAKECGCKVLMNAAPAVSFEEQYMKKCDIFVVNEVEAGFYLGRPIDALEEAEKGCKELADKYSFDCVVTMGAEGAVVCSGGQATCVPADKVEAVETTGAGDSYIGGIAYSLLEGKSLNEACEFATKCSRITVCGIGAQSSMPYLQEVKKIQ